MGYKLGLLLSSVFMMMVLLMAGDLFCISLIHSSLDSLSLTIAYRISYEGYISEETNKLAKEAGATLVVPASSSFRIGDVLEFSLNKSYKPLIISKNTIEMSLKRTTVVGYYESNI